MIVGVVAEFNPFHNGHKYQLDEINKRINPDLKIALISSDFVQRGELSILNVLDRTNIALDMGYDIVVEIPPYISFQNAEIYCSYSTRILSKLSVDIQVFGAETSNISEIIKMSELLVDDKIVEYTSKGYSYNKACSMVLKGTDLYKSNNILAMEYIRAIKGYNLDIKPYIIERKNVDYNDSDIVSGIASATRIREMIKNKEDISSLVPYNAKYSYVMGYEEKLFSLFKYIALTKNIDNIYDMTQDLKNYILKRLKIVYNYNDFINEMASRHISINRIKRLMLNVVLDISKEYMDNIKKSEISEIKILGINQKGSKYVKNLDFAKVNFKDINENIKYKLLYEYLVDKYDNYNSIYKEK
ncbi:nucleotidyltransferase family protein [Oceanivirga salmonicida]|uniref:nucleotidyltransferase family protein n=1 Tax=Oceanivirga salmonicida TaxID=1769291 RepID=UPI00083053D0|nr:nucleotidyltransferase family protein [Oceanivirga salmonicida]